MSRKQPSLSPAGCILLILVLANIIILKNAFIKQENTYASSITLITLLLLAVFNSRQSKYPFLRDYPIIGYVYYLVVGVRKFWNEDLDLSAFKFRKYKDIKSDKATEKASMRNDPKDSA